MVNAIRKVLSDDAAQSDSLSAFFSRALFFNRVEASSKQAVLRYLSERAVESGRVDAQFAQEVAERESASATSFGQWGGHAPWDASFERRGLCYRGPARTSHSLGRIRP